ncbi:MAG: hypothetical protein ACE5JE_04730 [Thermoplasmata archaeon]
MGGHVPGPPAVPLVRLGMGLVLIVLGILLLSARGLGLDLPIRAPRGRGPPFGVGG